MSDMENKRVLIVVFDALRPEFVTSELMPNLTEFCRGGVRYTNSHSTFPTETRVNQSAVITGCTPAGHGLVANKFIDFEASPGKVFNTGDEDELKAAFTRLNGELLHRPALGQRLAGIGKSFATISTGTPGGARLINHDAEQASNFRLSLHRPDAACPKGVMESITKAIGPLPEYQLPAREWVSYAVNCYLEYVETIIEPDVMLLWLSEPDESFHHIGIGSPQSLSAITHVDKEFGRILEHHQEQIESGCLQIIALSDHGQISLKGQPLDLTAKFKAGGFDIGTILGSNQQATAIIDNAGGIWLTRPDAKLLGNLIDWLQHQDWCGPLFTRDGSGATLKHADVGIAHARAPDISIVCRHDDGTNTWGIAGQTAHDAGYPVGGGCHGGLSRYELHNFLCLSGSCFGDSPDIDLPAGNTDITPTVMKLFGVDITDEVDGRILEEALRDTIVPGAQHLQEPVDFTLSSGNSSGAITHLSISRVGQTHYLNRAWVECPASSHGH